MSDRIVRMEEKIAFIDRHLQVLDEIVRQCADRMERLESEWRQFRQETLRPGSTEEQEEMEQQHSPTE